MKTKTFIKFKESDTTISKIIIIDKKEWAGIKYFSGNKFKTKFTWSGIKKIPIYAIDEIYDVYFTSPEKLLAYHELKGKRRVFLEKGKLFCSPRVHIWFKDNVETDLEFNTLKEAIEYIIKLSEIIDLSGILSDKDLVSIRETLINLDLESLNNE